MPVTVPATARTSPATLTPGGSTASLELFTALAHRWRVIVANTSPSTQTLTALRIRRRLSAAGAWSPWESISTGLPVAAGDSITISEADGCEEYVEVEVTGSASGATCTVEMAGR